MYKKNAKLNPDGTFGRKPYERVSGHVKSRIVARILDEGLSLRKAVIMYKINRRTITKWVNESQVNGLVDDVQHVKKKVVDLRMNNKQTKANEDKSLKSLKDALQREKLKNEALLEMIKIAEQNFKIKIRKKAGAKQSESYDKDIQA